MKRFDWSVRKDSRIATLPKIGQPIALLVRNLSSKNWVDSPVVYHHHMDGMATRNNDGFRQDRRFRKAYDRAVLASGWDYEIPYRIHQALWCSRQAQKVGGDFVELGTGRGFTMSAVLEDFPNWNAGSRSLHLFDTFISTSLDDHGKQALTGSPSPYYAKSIEEVKMNFSEWARVHIHQGSVFDTLPSLDAQIALLHIDMNFWEPEVFGLRTLWNKIPRGGVVLHDDYAYGGHEQQYHATNKLAQELNFDILSTPTGQGIILK